MVGIVTDSASDVSPDLGIKNGEAFPYVRMRSRARAVEWLYSFATKFK